MHQRQMSGSPSLSGASNRMNPMAAREMTTSRKMPMPLMGEGEANGVPC